MKHVRMPQRLFCTFLTGLFLAGTLWASTPTDIAHRPVTIWSDGARLAGDVFKPANLAPEEKLPGIILLHGWGGSKANLNRAYARQFANLGFVVLTFDFRSWGESEGFLLSDNALPRTTETGGITFEGKHVRTIVNPLKMLDDTRAAVSWLMGEPNLQVNNLGIWGTSLGGGLAVVAAAEDGRIKAVVSQVGAVNNKAAFDAIPDAIAAQWKTQRARGHLTPYPGPESGAPGLKGFPDLVAMKDYDPAAYWDRLNVPTLLIDAQNEELFDRAKNGEALHKQLQGRTKTRYLVLPGTHYDVYRGEGYALALKSAQDWFVAHLKES